MGSTDRRLEDKIDRLENKICELRTELHIYKAENIELDLELTQVKNENEDLSVDLARLKRVQARTESYRKKCSAKYNNLLDEMSMSEDDLVRELAHYKCTSDDLEENLADERKMFQKTMKILTEENDDYHRQKEDLLASLDDKESNLRDERKRSRELEDDLEALARAKDDAEQAFREEELKTAKLLNEHTGLNLKVQDMYTKQAKYKKQIRTMHTSRDHRRDEEVVRNLMDEDDSSYDSDSDKEEDYKSSHRDDERRRDRYTTRGRSRSPTPEWG